MVPPRLSVSSSSSGEDEGESIRGRQTWLVLRTEKRLVERVFWNEEAGRERRGRPFMLAAAQLIKMVGVPSYWIISMVFSYRMIPHRVFNDRRKY